MSYNFDTDAIVRWLGMENLDPAVQREILEEVKTEATRRVVARIEASLRGGQLTTFKRLKQQNIDQAMAYVDQSYGDLDKIFDQELKLAVREILTAEAQERRRLEQ